MVRDKLSRLLLLIMVSITTGAWASIPPPPVNQYLGITDARFKEMTFTTCIGCHGSPEREGSPLKSGYLPDRHHLRIDTPIGPYSASPYPEKSPDGKHKCVTCHLIDWVEDPSKPAGGFFRFAQNPDDAQFRDCLNCHKQKKDGKGELMATVHHLTDRAQRAQCHLCHGSLIDDPNGSHRIPDPANHPDDPERHYDISLSTPWPGISFYNDRVQLRSALEAAFAYKLELPANPTEAQLQEKEEAEAQIQYILENFDPPIGETGRPMGNCSYCHFAGIDDLTGQRININYANHHGTGVGQPGSGSIHTCSLCHQPYDPPDYTIRGCERCHGMTSLHSIEYDAVGDGITIGEELPFFGHIGNPKNCDGCHKNSKNEMAAASTGLPLQSATATPGIVGISRSSIVAGSPISLHITGSAFTDAPSLRSASNESTSPATWLRLLRSDGLVIDIPPENVSATHMEITIPSQIEAGSYNLSVTKRGPNGNELSSTSIHFLVRPRVSIEDIQCETNHSVTLTGSGFGGYVDAEGAGTFLSIDGEKCTIDLWNDNKIIASCAAGTTGSVHLKSVFGEAFASSSCLREEIPRWWTIWSWWSSWSWVKR